MCKTALLELEWVMRGYYRFHHEEDLGSLPVPDEAFKLQFKAQSRFLAEKRKVAKVVIDTLVLKHNAHRLSGAM